MRYQIWAYLYNERGGLSWKPVGAPMDSRMLAENLARLLWLDTRIDEVEE